MSELIIGSTAPDFTLPGDGGKTLSLSDYKGHYVVLYFYPKDDTPGCTTESCDFQENIKNFEKLGTTIIGISKDSVKSHDKFKAKYNLTFPLASDEEGTVCEAYGAWKEKSMYGKKYMGIERSTFLIDRKGKIVGLWRGVKIPGHIHEVKKAIQNVKKAA